MKPRFYPTTPEQREERAKRILELNATGMTYVQISKEVGLNANEVGSVVRRDERRKREGDQLLLRLPPGMRDRLQERAKQNGRAMSAEVIEALEAHLNSDSLPERVARIEAHLGLGKRRVAA